jgi:hypothetical protein
MVGGALGESTAVAVAIESTCTRASDDEAEGGYEYMEPTARVPSGDAIMAARSRGTLRRAAIEAGRYPTLVRPAEAALLMTVAAEEEAAAVTEEGRSMEVVAAGEVVAMRWVELEDRRAAAAKRRRQPRGGQRPGGGGGYPNPNLI